MNWFRNWWQKRKAKKIARYYQRMIETNRRDSSVESIELARLMRAFGTDK